MSVKKDIELKKHVKNIKKITKSLFLDMESLFKANDPIIEELYYELGKQIYISAIKDTKLLNSAFCEIDKKITKKEKK